MTEKFRDIGRVANAQEARSSVLLKGSDGDFYFVICACGFVVSVNLNKKTSSLHPFPNGEKEYPFGSGGSKSGKVYFGAGRMFYEFDPAIGEFSFFADVCPPTAPWGAEGWAPTESADGKIYFGACPVAHLMSFNPENQELTEYGVISDEEYLVSQVTDSTGWIYCALGTRNPAIVAFNLETHEKKTLIVRDTPGDSAEVRLATDGNVYGTVDGTTHGCEYRADKRWHRLYNGELCERMEKPFINYYHGDAGFDAYHSPLENPPEIVEQNLIEHELKYIHPETGELVTISLDYESDGAILSPITATPDGVIYGTTNHPLQLFTYDTKKDELVNHGGKPFAKHISGWGNICTYTRQGNILGGAAYCGGFITRIDLTQPICKEPDNVNPVCEGEFNEIYRPRSSASMPDGKTMVFSGFGVNGKAGGGMVVYDCISRTCREIPNEKLLCGHSVMAIVPIDETRILCATTINSPCGGVPVAEEAAIFEYDLASEEVIYETPPVAKAASIEHMKADSRGILHGITGDGIYFAFDSKSRTTLTTCDLSEAGTPVRDGMALSDDGNIYGLLTNGIYRITPVSNTAEIIASTPCKVESGIALIDGKIYFGSPTHLWEYTL